MTETRCWSSFSNFCVGAITAAVFLCSAGCAGLGRYFKNRALDFADIFTAKVGGGFGISAGVNLGGIFSAYTGVSKSHRIGFEGRKAVEDTHTVLGPPFYTLVVPVASLVRGDFDRYNNRPLGLFCVLLSILYPGDEKIHRNPNKYLSLAASFAEFSSADYELWLYKIGAFLGLNEDVDDPLSGGWRDYDIRIHICFFVSLEVGFNPIELADFLLGWFGLDIMGDDEPLLRRRPNRR